MTAREILKRFKEKYEAAILRVDMVSDERLFVYIESSVIKEFCGYVFNDLNARYVISIGVDDRPVSGKYLIAHNFAFDQEHVLCGILTYISAENPKIDSISPVVPAANWAEREFKDMIGVEPVGHPFLKRLILPDGWPEGLHPLRKDFAWNTAPVFDEKQTYKFNDPPEGAVVVPFGPFHPTLDEPAHFRLYMDGEIIKGCEYRGFMVHRGIEKLGESVLTYNEIPIMAERICGICGCVHNVAYAQAVEQAAIIKPPPRAEYIRVIMLELERIQSHLLWTGLASHLLGFDTLFMQAWRIREALMWTCEKISGNRKTYSLCVIGGVRWDITPALKDETRRVLDQIEREWLLVVDAVKNDRNIQARAKNVGVADAQLVKNAALVGPMARASGAPLDCRKDHPYAAYNQVEFNVITQSSCDVWGRLLVRVLEVFEAIKIARQCLDKLPEGPLQTVIDRELPPGRIGISSVEAPRGEAHHFVITGENNRPYRWRVRAPTYQNLQGVPTMIQGQQLADMTISLGSIDPCFSCTDRVEVVDARSGKKRIYSHQELLEEVRKRKLS